MKVPLRVSESSLAQQRPSLALLSYIWLLFLLTLGLYGTPAKGTKRGCRGWVRVERTGASLQPMDTGVRQAQSQHSDAIPAGRHQRRDQADLPWRG